MERWNSDEEERAREDKGEENVAVAGFHRPQR
jgi:hypothetical protein